MVRIKDITVEHRSHGTILTASDREDYLVSRTYVGYTMAEAKRLFRDYVNGGGR